MLNQQPHLNLREYRVYSEHGSKPEALSEKTGKRISWDSTSDWAIGRQRDTKQCASLWRHVLQFLLAHVRPESQNSEGVG